ncbi:hypothetical protein E2C01_039590 [Portunus trituberculatus]|uniref:Uncharacterized protein n=1 Tax=Portunus trituberculatus TaxID=210409 RepID=A0A5B7FL34_PORTR|nr:hypothetical protein [Portunus trituberculatus]
MHAGMREERNVSTVSFPSRASLRDFAEHGDLSPGFRSEEPTRKEGEGKHEAATTHLQYSALTFTVPAAFPITSWKTQLKTL